MCGLFGELRLDGQLVEREKLEKILPLLERRGPDDQGIYTSQHIGLAHRRLAIIDLSDAAKQPMLNAERTLAIVFNGTIYNYPQLRKELLQLGVNFTSNGDTEVILKAYETWGADCLTRLVGMFAFAIWDARIKKLFIARDRLGIKPLYFRQTTDSFAFASNSQALLALGDVDISVDVQALQHQLTLHAVVPAPRTILKGMRKLAPAHYMWVDEKGAGEPISYWQLHAKRAHVRSEQEWVNEIRHALQLAVDRRLQIADVPVGVLLSGGLDSSLLVGLLAQKHGRVNTYSVGFEDQPEERGHEFEYSDAVADVFATNHHRFHIANDQVLLRLPEAVQQMPEPMVAQDAVAFFLLAEQVSKDIKVVQSGQGADEVFAGYFWYPKMHAAEGDYIDRFSTFYFDRDFVEYAQSVNSDLVEQDFTTRLVKEALHDAKGETFIDSVFHFDVTTLIVDDPVKRVDSMTMAHGLEARVPFLDHELVELAMQMPPTMKLREGGKYVLKQIARGLLPDKVIDRKKGYFPMPALKYVRGDFLDMMRDTLSSAACRNRSLFSREYVQKLLDEPDQHHTRLNGSKLWHFALLEMWLQNNVDNAGYPTG